MCVVCACMCVVCEVACLVSWCPTHVRSLMLLCPCLCFERLTTHTSFATAAAAGTAGTSPAARVYSSSSTAKGVLASLLSVLFSCCCSLSCCFALLCVCYVCSFLICPSLTQFGVVLFCPSFHHLHCQFPQPSEQTKNSKEPTAAMR